MSNNHTQHPHNDAPTSPEHSNLDEHSEPSVLHSQIIDKITVTAQIKNAYYAGTSDTLLISLGSNQTLQNFCEAPRVGQAIQVSIDVSRMFGRPAISLSDIQGLTFFQAPEAHPIASDAWELESVTISANGIYSNTMNNIDTWLNNTSVHLQAVWSSTVQFANWRNSDHRPVDLGAQTYPIRWMPYISDLSRWRCYNPAEIDGVGQLVGVWNGLLIGNQLKSRTTEVLTPNNMSDSYTWVYTPEGSIIYRHWEHDRPADYIRHSQLGSGRPVMCAGEFKVKKHRIEYVIAMVNDASGHYKPDGGACLRYVAEKFESINIDTSHIEWRWTNTRS